MPRSIALLNRFCLAVLVLVMMDAALGSGRLLAEDEAPIVGTRRVLSIVDWLDWERASDAQISPDGRWIVYTRLSIDKYNDRWRRSLWILTPDRGRHEELVAGTGARWSPDGSLIAYIGADTDDEERGTEIFVRRMDDSATTTQVTHGADHPRNIAWSPDGRFLAFRARVPREDERQAILPVPGRPADAKWTPEPDVIDRLHYRVDRVGRVRWYTHLFIVPVDGGTPRDLTPGPYDVGARAVGAIDIGSTPEWTPDGRHIVFTGMIPEKSGAEPDPFISHIYMVRVADGKIRRITNTPGFWERPKISPDGKLIAYAGFQAGTENYLPRELRVVDLSTGRERILLANLADDAQDLFWEPSGRGVYFTMNHAGRTDLFHVTLDGKLTQLTEGMHRLRIQSMTRNGRAAGVITAPEITRNVALVRISRRKKASITPLTDLNRDILAGVELGRIREFWADSTEGARIQGWMITPPAFDPDKRYPMLLSIHGGPWSMYGVDFNFLFQAWASRGYVVVYSNPRGSTGYGPDFAMAINGRYPGKRDFADLMAVVDKAIALGPIDRDRLFVTGCSGGGVLTSWVVSHTDRFKAAAALCPVEEWISFAGRTDIVAWAHRMFPKPFWEDPSDWIAHSPLLHVGKVRTPTLLMTGDRDLRTPLGEAESFYAALKMRGIPTRLVVMRREWHGTTSRPSNLLRTILYLDDWFARFDPARKRTKAEEAHGAKHERGG